MSVYRDEKQKSWYVSVRYVDWRGEKSRKVKRGFKTKKEALEWENSFLNESSGKLEMTFGQFVEVYEENLKERLRLTTWQTKVSIIESKMLPYFNKKRMIDIRPSDVIAWQNKLMSFRDENGERYDEDFDEDYEDEEFEDNEEEFEGGPRPQYPFYAYSNGKEVRDDTLESFDLDVFSF